MSDNGSREVEYGKSGEYRGMKTGKTESSLFLSPVLDLGPFVKADKITKRAKILKYGPPGTGKTLTSLWMPGVVMIDMEKGSTSYGGEYDFHVIHATTANEVMESVRWLLTNSHDFQTLVVDPITVHWAALQEKWSEIFLVRNKGQKGDKFDYYDMQMRDWGTVKAEGKLLMRLISRLDMNVIATAHQKDLIDGDTMKKMGVTYDGMKGIDYFFDTILRHYKQGDTFMAVVEKDRTGTFMSSEIALDKDVFTSAYGVEVLGRKAVPIKFATNDQQERLLVYFGMDFPPMKLPMSPDRIKRFLSKECDGVNEVDEITYDHAEALLEKLDKVYEEKKNGNG